VTARGGRVAAAIDVGSNSVLLLTVSLEPDGRARAVDEAVATTRLGAGLAPSGTLDRDAVARTRASVVDFADRARARGAESVWAFATGAARRAADGAAFAMATATAAGVPVEILSGEREAALAYAAAVHGLGLAGDAVLAIDVGGATTELTPFRTFATQVAFSFQLQLGFGVELPTSVQVRYPTGREAPPVPATWSIFLRIQSDGRYFFGSREDLQPPR